MSHKEKMEVEEKMENSTKRKKWRTPLKSFNNTAKKILQKN